MKKYKNFLIDNAVILAAGCSSRFVPLCFDLPKGLLPIGGSTLIERQILQLKGVGINEIYVVVGYRSEMFGFLKDRYKVKIIFNEDYSRKNNFSSIYAARDVLKNSIVTSCDLFFRENVFQKEAAHSYYLSCFSKGKTSRRSLVLNETDKIIGVSYGGCNCWTTFGGCAFFTKSFSKKLLEYIERAYDDPAFIDKYWVDFQDAHLKELPMYIKRIDVGGIVEFNSMEDLLKFDGRISLFEFSPTVRFLCSSLGVSEFELKNFVPILDGLSAIGCKFLCRGKWYEYFHGEKSVRECENGQV